MNYTTIDLTTTVEEYIENGWFPLPLPSGEKQPPPLKSTGNVPELSDAQMQAIWESAPENCNVGLRLRDDVIAIDVDHYDTKAGADTLSELTDELGPLPKTWSTTRRGADSESRKYFFLVPGGCKWEPSAGADIDVIQSTHRYVIVFPSVVGGEREQWYAPNGKPCEIPNADDLPDLPEAWVAFLKKGELSLKNAPAEDLDNGEAYEWLSSVAPGWDLPLSPGAVSALPVKIEDMANNAHDTMVAAVRWAVRWSVLEGQTGLKALLDALCQAFEAQEGPRLRGDRMEFARAVVGEVNAVRGEVEAGKHALFVSKAVPVSLEGATTLVGAERSERSLSEALEAVRYMLATERGDNLPAALLQWWNDSLIVVRGRGMTGKGTSDLYDTATGRFVDVPTLMTLCEDLSPILEMHKAAADVVLHDEQASEEEHNRAQAQADAVKSLLNYFATKRRVTDVQDPLKGKLEAEGRARNEDEFDKDPWVLLLSDGLILDLKKANRPGATLTECVRPRHRGDLITPDRMLGVSGADIERYAGTSREIADLYQIIFPDPAVREQVYRAQAYSLLGENSHRLLWGLIGEPGTGKGTATKAYTGVLGSYTVPTALSALTDTGGNNTKLATALKARVATMSEFSPESRGDVNMLKAISGDDIIQVADKYKVAEQVRSGTTLFFETNHPPSIEADRAFRDRLMVVPMEGDRPTLEAWLSEHTDWARNKANLVGHLEMLIEHFHSAYRDGFKDDLFPEKMVRAADEFVAEGDPLAEWIEDNFVFDPEGRLTNADLNFQIKAAQTSGDLPPGMTASKIKQRLVQAGAVPTAVNQKFKVDGKAHRGLYGVRIAPAHEVLPLKRAS